MTYESTGAVRKPKRGEHFLSDPLHAECPGWARWPRTVIVYQGPESINPRGPRVIMRPIEPEPLDSAAENRR